MRIIEDGQVVLLTSDSIELGEQVPAGYVFVDGLGIGDVEQVVLGDRSHLAADGMVIVTLGLDRNSGELKSGPELISRGFMEEGPSAEVLEEARRAVIADLHDLPRQFQWRVVCGLTGSGKSRLLRALAQRDAQVLDLEALAAHRGSVLGNLPGEPQPSQKMFESMVWAGLRKFDAARPVLVEAESKKIGSVRVPEALIASMWNGECIRLEAAVELRVAMLQQEYQHFVSDPGLLGIPLDCLTALYGQKQIDAWKALAAAGRWDTLVRGLLENHYDPAYTRSTLKHYPHYANGMRLELPANNDAAFDGLAAQCLKAVL